ncbi:hypothetical protein CRE_25609 [Caenorhabditis remanei]|uniref:Uncharacterized protein n=1 Tax=Caenorhabditis remanei TaxID=31234 RepID=E3LSL2_CAERE|nr:hypothetical protein CRE_25609 [Caenorhabditis remanei]
MGKSEEKEMKEIPWRTKKKKKKMSSTTEKKKGAGARRHSSPIGDVTMVIPPMVYRNSLTVPTSPFFISDNGMSTYRDEPPSYNEIVDRGVSPVPCQPKVALPEV